MNIKLGLLRLWVVLSVVWIAGIAWLAYEAQPSEPTALEKEWDKVSSPVKEPTTGAEYTIMAASLPVGSLVFGGVVFWIVAGFKRSD